jgi:hypothetical protein
MRKTKAELQVEAMIEAIFSEESNTTVETNTFQFDEDEAIASIFGTTAEAVNKAIAKK